MRNSMGLGVKRGGRIGFSSCLMGKMLVPLGVYPLKEAFKRGYTMIYPITPNKYLYKVYMLLIIKGTIPRVPPFSL